MDSGLSIQASSFLRTYALPVMAYKLLAAGFAITTASLGTFIFHIFH